MNSNKMPGWLVVLLAVVGVAILGPPALVLLMVALGAALAVSVAALKVGLVLLAVAAVVVVLRALFGKPQGRVERVRSGESLDDIAARMEAEELLRREALDRELARALNQAPGQSA